MIRIAFFIDTIATPGAGTEKQLLMLLKGLDRNKFDPTLVCMYSSDWLRAQSLPFAVEILDSPSLFKPSLFIGLSRFAKLHRQKNFDIVQTFFRDGNVFGTLAAKTAGIKCIVSSRRNIGYWHNWFQRSILHLLRHWTPYYLGNSQAVVEVTAAAEGVPRERFHVIYNGLDLSGLTNLEEELRLRQRREWGVGDDETLIGAIANLRPVKNVPSFISAASTLAARYPRTKFVVAGEGNLRGALEQQITNANLAGRFLLVGAQEDIRPVLAAFDIAVQCSKSESFSNSLVEYMAAGLPIVASAVGGNVEAISHEVSGLLYGADDRSGLADNLTRLLDDAEWARELGLIAARLANERYDHTACIREHEAYYERILRTAK